MNSLSFGDFMTVGGLNQKTIKVDLFMKVNYGIPSHNRHGKTLEDLRRSITEAEPMSLRPPDL